MVIGFMLHITRRETDNVNGMAKSGFWVFAIASVAFIFMFLYSGYHSVPRRWAEHLAVWVPYDRIATAFGFTVLIVLAWFFIGLLRRLGNLHLEA
jgi:cytochrome c oxidase subunit 1